MAWFDRICLFCGTYFADPNGEFSCYLCRQQSGKEKTDAHERKYFVD